MKQGLFPIFLIVFLLGSTVTFAQKGNIHGFVKEAETGDAMIGASVFIEGTSTGTVTDFNGEFTLSGISEGPATLEFTYLGFSPLKQVVEVVGGSTQELTIAMEYESVSLIEGEVIVTAQASAQMAAINKQRSSNTIANVISVKRIQELPDANAAEVVGRLPGVSLQREGGEGSKVVIRGLAPKYNSVTIEGVSMASTGGDDRSTDMSMISPYMLEGIEVFKAAMPDKEANAHGGTVNFVLKEAPKGFKLNGLLQGGYGDINKYLGNFKTVVGLSNRFFNNKLGFFVQGNFEKRNRQSHSLTASYGTTDLVNINTTARDITLSLVDREIKRKGGVIILDYALKNGSIKLSNFGSSIGRDYIQSIDQYGVTFVTHDHQLNLTKTDLLVATNALSISQTLGAFKIDLKASRAYSQNKTPESFTFGAREESAFSTNLNKKSPAKSIIATALNNYSQTYINRISQNDALTKEKEYAGGIDVTFSQTISPKVSYSIKVGGKIKRLTKENDVNSSSIRDIQYGGYGAPFRQAIANFYPEIADSIGSDPTKIPYVFFVDRDYNNTDFLDKAYTLRGVPSLEKISQLRKLANEAGYLKKYYPSSEMRDYKGHEEYTAGYIMSEIKIGRNLTFIPGVRYEQNVTTYQASRGIITGFDSYSGYKNSIVETTRKNNFWLPMVQAKYKMNKWLDLRAAFTHTLARPNYNQITPFWNISSPTIEWHNAYLKPSLSENIDFSVSAFDSKIGFVSIGVFKKKIKDLVFNAGLSYVTDPDEYGLPANLTNGSEITKIVNNKFPLDLWGIETEWKTRFWYLDNFLKGVVLNINYTKTFSEVKYPHVIQNREDSDEPPFLILSNVDTFYTDRFLLQPNDIFNTTIGYDYKGFTARLSYLFRADIFSRTDIHPELRANTTAYSRWDLSFKQKLPKGTEVLLNFANLYPRRERIVLAQSGYPVNEQHYGMTIDLGIRYRFQ